MLDLASIQNLLDPLFPGLMGVRVTEIAADRVVAEMEVRADLCTAGGILLLTAVSMHLDQVERRGAMTNLATLLAAKGLLALGVRHGPVPPGRLMFDATNAMTEAEDRKIFDACLRVIPKPDAP